MRPTIFTSYSVKGSVKGKVISTFVSSATTLLLIGNLLPASAAVEGGFSTGSFSTSETVRLVQADSAYVTLIDRAQQQLDEGDATAALATFGEAIESEPNLARGWVGKGEALYGLGRFDEAAIALTQAVKLAPDYLYAWVWLGNAYDDAGQLDRSLAAYAEAINIDATNPMPYYHRGIALWYAQEGERAERDFRQVTESMADFSRGWMWLGRSLQQQTNYDEALVAFEQALLLESDMADALFGKGVSLLELEQYEAAIAPLDAYLAQRPDSASAWFYRGNSLFGTDQYSEALSSYDQSIEISSDNEGTWYNRGLVLANMERYAEAIESFSRVLSLNPNNADAQRQIDELESIDRASGAGVISSVIRSSNVSTL